MRGAFARFAATSFGLLASAAARHSGSAPRLISRLSFLFAKLSKLGAEESAGFSEI
jgi:hypothetical protein